MKTQPYPQAVQIWDARSGREARTLRNHTSLVRCAAFSRDSQRLATGSDDRTTIVWDATTGKELLTFRGHTGSVMSLDFNADDTKLVAACADGTIKIWDARPLPQ